MCFAETPDPALKGIKGGNCNRTHCQKPPATWYNQSTEKFYCEPCARVLNRANPIVEPISGATLYGFTGTTLCIKQVIS